MEFRRVLFRSAGTVFPFAALQYDAINVLSLAIEKAKSTDPLQFSKAIIGVTNGPGAKVATGHEVLPLVRKGAAIDFPGGGPDLRLERKSVGKGKGVSVRVNVGGSRNIKK